MASSDNLFPLSARRSASSRGITANMWDRDSARRQTIPIVEPGQHSFGDDLLMREIDHRWSNDLQLIIGLLALQSRRTSSAAARQALTDAVERVSILSRARSAMYRDRQQSLEVALQHVCEALQVQAELRSISMLVEVGDDCDGLPERVVTTLALVVNELATNAIKHAFDEGSPGLVRIAIGKVGDRGLRVTVEDDGRPFPGSADGGGIGLKLAQNLMRSIDGLFIPPGPGSKQFELRVPSPLAKPASMATGEAERS